MREILFRGKLPDKSKWVEGSLRVSGPYTDGSRTYEIFEAKAMPYVYSIYDVAPATVGQYTGLCDKNGKKIFEGDIVQLLRHVHSTNALELVEYCGGGFSPFAIPGWECTPDACDVEVIGNIHDNPELLGEG